MSLQDRDLLHEVLAVDPTAAVEEYDRRRAIERALQRLPEVDRRVVCLRFGFDGRPMTLREVGQMLEVTPERVRQLQARALRRLRRAAASTGIGDFAPVRRER